MTAAPKKGSIPLPAPPPAARRWMVLLVDDEPFVRKMVEEILARAGVAVLTAGSGEDALDISRSYAGPLDLLLTDVKMPGMSGLELAEYIRIERPGTQILLMSGHPPAELNESASEENFIGKPFAPADLVGKIQELLARRDGPQQPEGSAGPPAIAGSGRKRTVG